MECRKIKQGNFVNSGGAVDEEDEVQCRAELCQKNHPNLPISGLFIRLEGFWPFFFFLSPFHWFVICTKIIIQQGE